jgi:hypothetical protein
MPFENLNIRIVERPGGNIAVVGSDAPVIYDRQSALDFAVYIGYERECRSIVVNKAAVSEDFFQLSSGVAGEVVQRFVNFGYRLAIVGDFSVYTSKPLHDFVYESNNGKYLYFAADEDEAIEKFSG